MSEEVVTTPEELLENEDDGIYKPPPEKTIEEILEIDQDDESLRKYKETLLGEAQVGPVIVEPDNPKKVILKRLVLVVPDRPEVSLDLTGDLSKLKKETFIIKEGISYRMRIEFIVQREIVHGLKYIQKTSKLGVTVDKITHMVGSFAPNSAIQSYTTSPEDAPFGMISRGTYTVHSLFTDDDKNEHLKWDWTFEIRKDWKD
ncbi:rho GDP-dissociation inhibitor 2 [Diorhabda carinulata]|uniref:rho GDP-dissociation inhibitor 2 n=1 Tax=Diorhabda sublineata TaxID=1163346 RepID=UPI0024E0C094|nr:rho GDP-dissociation inhibitor 2 [Diorhabda sublineata]XP_056636837.1 rho GDP-dissociation inhibitor 2 [Diorhabda sublineata]XP_057654684.1 rho GDP-dissociation inhibitor 2 [Diorhabda carinulata]